MDLLKELSIVLESVNEHVPLPGVLLIPQRPNMRVKGYEGIFLLICRIHPFATASFLVYRDEKRKFRSIRT
jgi:hypothetical protein